MTRDQAAAPMPSRPDGLATADLEPGRQAENSASLAADDQAGAELGATFTPVDYSTWPAPAEWRHDLRPSEYHERFRAMDELATRPRAASSPPLQAQPRSEFEPPVLEQAELEAAALDVVAEVMPALGLAALRDEVRRRQREAVRVAKISPTAAGRLWQSYHRLRRELADQERALSGRAGMGDSGRAVRKQRRELPSQMGVFDEALGGKSVAKALAKPLSNPW